MAFLFYICAAVAVVSTALVITRTQVVHALLYLILSLLAVAVIFFMLGAPFAAALEVIVYAGAIMVLFIFVIMMLNLGADPAQEKLLLTPSVWIGPGILAAVLFAVFVLLVIQHSAVRQAGGMEVGPIQVAASLFGPYLLGVELASFILLAGLIAAFHLGKKF